MKVDRKLFERAKEAIQNDSDISKAVEEEHWENAIKFVREKFENKPDYYLNLEQIRKSENLDRRVTWREFLEKIFGHIETFKSKDELLEEECEKFVSIYKPDSKDVPYIYDYIKAYATDEKFRHIIDNGHFGELHVYPGFSMQEFRNMDEKWRKTVPEYVKDYVPLNTYL